MSTEQKNKRKHQSFQSHSRLLEEILNANNLTGIAKEKALTRLGELYHKTFPHASIYEHNFFLSHYRRADSEKGAEIIRAAIDKVKLYKKGIIDRIAAITEKMSIDAKNLIERKNLISDTFIEMIKKLPTDLPSDKQQKFIDFYNQVSLSVPQKFKRVAGYENLKKMFIDDFVIGTVGVDKIAKDGVVNMPNVILLYGPTGVGKSNLANAVAEVTDSFVLKPMFSQIVPNKKYFLINDDIRAKYFELVKKQCEEAKINYEKNVESKKRTIIILDETDSVLTKDVKIKDKFYDLIKNSNEKYKAIFFITTNNPLDLDERFLSNEICGSFNSFKDTKQRAIIGIPPVTRHDADAIIRHHYNNMGQSLGSESTKPFVDMLFKTENSMYCNKDIKNIINGAFQEAQTKLNKLCPSINDCVEYMKKINLTPIINVKEWRHIFEQMTELIIKTMK